MPAFDDQMDPVDEALEELINTAEDYLCLECDGDGTVNGHLCKSCQGTGNR